MGVALDGEELGKFFNVTFGAFITVGHFLEDGSYVTCAVPAGGAAKREDLASPKPGDG